MNSCSICDRPLGESCPECDNDTRCWYCKSCALGCVTRPATHETKAKMDALFEENPVWKAKADNLRHKLTVAHNACHDWLIAHPDSDEDEDGTRRPPMHLRKALMDAEDALEAHRESERQRYYAACKRGSV